MRQKVATFHGHLQAIQDHKQQKYNNYIKTGAKQAEYQNIF
jgi:hypothetical protein